MNISDGEMKLMELIWQGEPIRSGELVTDAFNKLGWKKSTVYTVIKKLANKNMIKSENAVITSVKGREDVLSENSESIINKTYGGSLPMFLTAFLSREKLSEAEAEDLKRLIDNFTESKTAKGEIR